MIASNWAVIWECIETHLPAYAVRAGWWAHATNKNTAPSQQRMESLRARTFLKPNLVSCIRILQNMTDIVGMSCKNGFGFNFSSVTFTLMVIWYGICFLGREVCAAGCNTTFTFKSIVILLLEIRLIQFGVLVCIIKFRCSAELVRQIHHLTDHLRKKNAGFVSFKHRRRNYIISSLFFIWVLSKVVQFNEMQHMEDEDEYREGWKFLRHFCVYMGSWPLTILNWQFLAWMQAYGHSMKISLDELRYAVIQWQKKPTDKHEIRIFESASQVRAILGFKEKILRVYGPSILFLQLRASLWVVLNAYAYYRTHGSLKLIFLTSMFVYNVIMAFLPHWIGEEISSEVRQWQGRDSISPTGAIDCVI